MAGPVTVRNTPTEDIHSISAEGLYNRKTRTLIPAKATSLRPRSLEGTGDALLIRRQKQAEQYNRSSKELPELNLGDVVRVQPSASKGKLLYWPKARFNKTLPNRSYEVTNEAGSMHLQEE